MPRVDRPGNGRGRGVPGTRLPVGLTPQCLAPLRAQTAAAWLITHFRYRRTTHGPVSQSTEAEWHSGNPFAPVAIDEAWRTSTVLALARVIHAERASELFPVLGDALQDAGCGRAEILDHCYGPGAHASGCWVLDAILGNG